MLIKELIDIVEARDPNLKYENKVKKATGQIERVIVTLEGNQSGKFTRAAQSYKKLKKEIESMLTQQKTDIDELRANAEELFNAEDEVYTRVVETCSITITVAKATAASEKEVIDYEAIIKSITEMVPELTEQIARIKKEKTELVPVAAKASAVTIKIDEDVISTIKNRIRHWYDRFKNWMRDYDERLKTIQGQLALA